MTIEELRTEIASGAIDTVVIAMTDMQGRLVGSGVGVNYLDSAIWSGEPLLGRELPPDPQDNPRATSNDWCIVH